MSLLEVEKVEILYIHNFCSPSLSNLFDPCEKLRTESTDTVHPFLTSRIEFVDLCGSQFEKQNKLTKISNISRTPLS